MSLIKEKILKNTVFNFLSSLILSISRFVTSVIIARMLGPVLMGAYSLVTFTISVLDIITSLGLQNLAIKYISEFDGENNTDTREKIIRYILKIKIILTIAGSIFLITFSRFFARFYADDNLKTYILIAAIALLPAGIAAIGRSIMQGLQDYRALTFQALLSAPLSIIITLFFLYLGFSVNGVIAVTVFTSTVDLIIYYFFIRRHIKLRFCLKTSLPPDLKKRLITYNWHLAIIVILDAIIWQRSEVFFLGRLSSQADVAFYSVAYNLSSWIIAFLPGMFGNVLFPVMSELFGKNEKNKLNELYILSTRYLMIFSIPFCFAGIGLSSTIIRLMYGSAYLPMTPVLNILLVSSCFGIIASPGSSVYYATERQRYIIKIGLCIAIVNIILNLSLIPSFGAIGAAIVNSFSQIAAVLIGTSVICRALSIRFPIKDLVKTIFSGLCMLAWINLSSFFIEGILHAILSFLTGIIIYVIMIFEFKVITKTDVKLFGGMKEKFPAIIQPSYSKLLRAMQYYAS